MDILIIIVRKIADCQLSQPSSFDILMTGSFPFSWGGIPISLWDGHSFHYDQSVVFRDLILCGYFPLPLIYTTLNYHLIKR